MTLADYRCFAGAIRFRKVALRWAGLSEALDALTPIAPLHQPASLVPVRALAELRPDLLQIGCFDTPFPARTARQPL